MSFISIQELYKKYQTCSEVATDTRKITPNSMFFALKGPNFDANTFAAEALIKGASFSVVDNPEFVTQPNILLVEDTLLALQQLAIFHRKNLAIPFIGLTGSNGKTTTKELINRVLSKKYKTYATIGNLNNHIGVPLTVLAIDSSVEVAIIEMGANKQGDIKELADICEPTHGFITNIGKAHLEGFGGIEGVKKGKGELYDFLAKNKGIIFANTDSEATLGMLNERTGFKEIHFFSPSPAENVYFSSHLLQDNPIVVFEDETGTTYQSHLTGKYNFDNMCAAMAIGKYFGINAQDASEAVASYNPTNNRSQLVQKGSNWVLMDAYNANPSSMNAAITYFENLKAEKKLVILGDMFELGEDAAQEHKILGELLAKCHFDIILLAGELMQNALIHLPNAYYFPDKFGLHLWLQDHPQTHTHILVKGSRGMGLESVLQFL